MKTYHVKKGDAVKVNAGNFKGAEATVIAVLTKNDRVVLNFTDKVERKLGRRTLKKSKDNPQGGMVERSASVHVSNVNPVQAKAAKDDAKSTPKAKSKSKKTE